jgi:uncharacterized protein (DUF2147 family)
MKRVCYRLGSLAGVMMLGSSAHAGSFSFTYHGHRVHVERPRHCFSMSCLSVMVPGGHGTRPGQARVDDMASDTALERPATPSSPLSPAPATPLSFAPPPVQSKPTPAPPPRPDPPKRVPADSKPSNAEKSVDKPAADKAAVEKSVAAAQAVPGVPSPAGPSRQPDTADTPLGDWQTEGNKGLVRIEPCNDALCGYTVDTATDAKGEPVLINMKPNSKSEWTGTIVSRAGESTYYAKMTMKQPYMIRVETCTIGRFFCYGNDWSRVATNPQQLISSRRGMIVPPS